MGRIKKEVKYVCYTGIGSNKTGTHTEKDFKKRMEKNRDNLNISVPKSVKTDEQWIKFVGADKGKCKTKKKPFKLTHQQIKKSCRDECRKTIKTFPVMMKKTGKIMGLNKEEIEIRIKEYNKHCEKNCVHIMKDKKMVKRIIKSLKGGEKRKRKRKTYKRKIYYK